MTHYSEDDLILHYYGEGPRRGFPSRGSGSSRATSRGDIEHHLETCAECVAAYHALVETLRLVVAPEVPERDDTYPLAVWQRIRSRLPEHHVLLSRPDDPLAREPPHSFQPFQLALGTGSYLPLPKPAPALQPPIWQQKQTALCISS